MTELTPTAQTTTITGYSYTILENGNIVPLLNVEPEVKTLTGRPIKAVPVFTWHDFNTIHPRVGDKLSIGVNNYGIIGIKNLDADFSTLPIPMPKECPLCGTPLNVKPYDDYRNTIRCENPQCGYWEIQRILRYVTYCSLVVDLTYRDILKLYNSGIVKNILDLYNLTPKDIADTLYFDIETAKKIVNNIKENVDIPIQNLIYSLMPNIEPKVAVKLGSGVNDKWYNGVKNLGINSYISRKDKLETKLAGIAYMLCVYMEKVKDMHMRLDNIIKVIYLPVKQFLGGKLIVIGNLVSMPREYLETVIKLNGGRVDDNYKSIIWNNVSYIISTGLETNENIIQAMDYGVLRISEDEFRTMLDCKIANEPDINRMNFIKHSIGIYTEGL